MRSIRGLALLAWIALLATTLSAGQGKDVGKTVGVRTVSPDYLTVGKAPAEVALSGWGFAPGSRVRIRTKGIKKSGTFSQPVVDSPELLRVTLTPDQVAGAGVIEFRVKNPDGSVSEWVPVEIRTEPVP